MPNILTRHLRHPHFPSRHRHLPMPSRLVRVLGYRTILQHGHPLQAQPVERHSSRRARQAPGLFGSGRSTPHLFHENHPAKSPMYILVYIPVHIPVSRLEFSGSFGVASEPPVMRGWLNFVQPSSICYNAGTSIRQLLRNALESIGVRPPLMHGSIAMADGWMRYVRAMTLAWADIMNMRLPVNEWLVKAE